MSPTTTTTKSNSPAPTPSLFHIPALSTFSLSSQLAQLLLPYAGAFFATSSSTPSSSPSSPSRSNPKKRSAADAGVGERGGRVRGSATELFSEGVIVESRETIARAQAADALLHSQRPDRPRTSKRAKKGAHYGILGFGPLLSAHSPSPTPTPTATSHTPDCAVGSIPLIAAAPTCQKPPAPTSPLAGPNHSSYHRKRIPRHSAPQPSLLKTVVKRQHSLSMRTVKAQLDDVLQGFSNASTATPEPTLDAHVRYNHYGSHSPLTTAARPTSSLRTTFSSPPSLLPTSHALLDVALDVDGDLAQYLDESDFDVDIEESESCESRIDAEIAAAAGLSTSSTASRSTYTTPRRVPGSYPLSPRVGGGKGRWKRMDEDDALEGWGGGDDEDQMDWE